MTAPARRLLLGRRSGAALALGLLAAVAWLRLDLGWSDLWPDPARGATARAFFAAAVTPALEHQSDDLPPGADGLPLAVLRACLRTLAFAAGGMLLAVVGGTLLGAVASRSWWSDRDGRPGRGAAAAGLAAARATIALMRSVHELLWAVLFLAALGASPAAGAVAIAIPYAGTLAKVFSEQVDEAPRDAARALGGLGATRTQRFVAGLAPRALAQMASFAFYQFECSLRSAAVLGFFGYPTLGYHIAASFTNAHFREVWTYLYALLAMVVALELWSARLRVGGHR